MKLPSRPLTLAVVLAAAGSLHGQTSWTGGGTDDLWSTPENWSAGAPISTSDVTFGNVDKTTSSTPNSVVPAGTTIRTLTFNNTGVTASDWQNVEISASQNLTISSTTTSALFSVTAASNSTTLAKIGGAGTLTLSGGTTADLTLTGTQGAGANPYSFVTLDLSSLGTLSATLDTLNVGETRAALATLNLASSNTITANTVTVGSNVRATGTGAGGNSVLNLGAANTLNTNAIVVGAAQARSGGTLQFSSVGSAITIRGRSGGSSRANLSVSTGSDGSQTLTNSVNFNGSTVDALLDNMNVGNSSVGNGTITGNFSMNLGTVDANFVSIGSRTGSGSGAATGNLNVAGGTLTAGSMRIASQAATATNTANGVLNISGTGAVQVGTSSANADLVMGVVTGTVNLTANATVNITGGSLTVYGNVAEGANAGTGTINSVLTLNGGTLDLTNHAVTVDTFNLQSGTLRNLAQFNGGANLVKSTSGALTLQGTNTYTGSTMVNAGSLLLADNASMEFYIQADGINNRVAGAGAVTLDGDFVFDLSGAAAEGTWTIVDVGTLTESFGSTFSVLGFTESSAGVWQLGGYTFTEATGILTAVPEPSALWLASLGLMTLLRRNRRSRAGANHEPISVAA